MVGGPGRGRHREDRGRDKKAEDEHRQPEVDDDQPGRELVHDNHAADRALGGDRDERRGGKPGDERARAPEHHPRGEDGHDQQYTGDRADGAVGVLDDRVQVRGRVGAAVAEWPVGASKPGA